MSSIAHRPSTVCHPPRSLLSKSNRVDGTPSASFSSDALSTGGPPPPSQPNKPTASTIPPEMRETADFTRPITPSTRPYVTPLQHCPSNSSTRGGYLVGSPPFAPSLANVSRYAPV